MAAKGLALLALLGLALVTGPSCTTVLGIDDYGDAAQKLCEKLDQCYSRAAFPTCFARLELRVEGTDLRTREDWLVNFSRSACLSSCVSARSCLDGDPLCGHSGCTIVEDCCGFSTGGAACEDHQCCAPKGVACGGANDLPCCGGTAECNGGFCGGTPCGTAGMACTSGEQCCTGQCIGGKCASSTCNPTGFECDSSDNCCKDAVCSPDHLCVAPAACQDLKGACHTDADCCQTADVALYCFHPTAGSGVCSTCSNALPQDSECFADTDCCFGLRCDTAVTHTCVPACTTVGQTCQMDADCCSGACQPPPGGGPKVCVKACSMDYCSQDDQCCTGKCLPGGTCAPACQDSSACDHDVCSAGGPLSTTCTDMMPVNVKCVAAVCGDDPYCCCQAWDDLCAERAAGAILPVHSECVCN